VAEKGRSTQSLANTFPTWANLRVDEQSLGFQFLNSVGKHLDDLRKQLRHVEDNFYLPSSIISDIDVYYRHQLPRTWDFTKQDDDDTEFVFTAPTVSGYYGTSIAQVQLAVDNDIESFWYTLNPDRLTLETTMSGNHVLASGSFLNVLFSPSPEMSGLLYSPNRLYVTVDSGVNFVGLDDGQRMRRVVVQIEGLTREGGEVTEEMIFVHNDTRQTYHDFKYVADNGMRAFGALVPENTSIRFKCANFNAEDYPVHYELDSTPYGDDMPLFWALGSGVTNATRTLDLKKYDIDDLGLRMEGFTTKHTIIQQELLDPAGSSITPLDLAVEPYSNRLWVATSGMVYIYSSALSYPNTSQLMGKNYNALSVIELNTYYAVINEEVELNYVWRRPTTGLVAHRVWVEKPDGVKKSLEDGVEVTYHVDPTSWIYGEPQRRRIRPTEFYTLDQYGDWIFSMEVTYTDETTSIDRRIVSVLSQCASAEYNLTSLGLNSPILGIDFDSEDKLWVTDNDGMKHQLDRHWDCMLVDFDKRTLYFREGYDRVRVFDD